MTFSNEEMAKLRVLKYKLLERSENAQRVTGYVYDLLLQLGEILKTKGAVLYSQNKNEKLVFEDKEKGWKFALYLNGIGMGADHISSKTDPTVDYKLVIYPLDMIPTKAKKDLLSKYPVFIEGFLTGFDKMNEEFQEEHEDLKEVLKYLIDPMLRI
jgi:hypothetical protein